MRWAGGWFGGWLGNWLGGRVAVEAEEGGGHFSGRGEYAAFPQHAPSLSPPRVRISLTPGDSAARARAQRRRRSLAMLSVVVADLLEAEDAEDAAGRDPLASIRQSQ